jgi:prophage antirepressor-like protein/phage anti-repressor protein
MFDKRKPLPLPPMVFRDVRFEVVYVDEEPCLRSDQIGQALRLDPPESKILELYQAHRGHFSDFITRVVVVPLESGARPMRVFTLWGTLSLAKSANTPAAPDFETWITELMMIRGYSLHWEVIRLHGENADLWGRLVETEAEYRLVSAQMEELRAELVARRREETAHLDGKFRRLSEEQQAGFAALAEWLTERWANPPNQDAGLKPLFGSLLEVVEGMYERIGKLEPVDGKPKPGVGENIFGDPREREEEEREPPFDPARAAIASIGPFTVYAATLRGYDCRLIDGRELWTRLESKQQFSTWMKDRIAWYGFREGVDYVLVHDYGNFNRKDYFLRLGAALDLVWFDRSPRAGEVHAELVKVARQERGNVIEGEAVRVSEGTAVTVTHCFDKKWNIRTVMNAQGEIWWIGKDVCDALEYADAAQAVKQHCKRAKPLNEIASVKITEGGEGGLPGNTKCICEADLYRLILKSTKPEAERFEVWVMEEVLPTLFKTGRYEMPGTSRASTASMGVLPDTPPDRPLMFRFHDGKKAVRVRVAAEGGRPWFLLKDLAAAMKMKWGEARGTFASLPAELRRLLPSPTGECTEPALSEAGLWFFLGNWRGLSNAGLLRAWMIDDVFPALDTGRTVPASKPTPTALPLPPEAHYTHRDPLQMTFVALADALLRAEGHPFHTAPVNHGRFLAWLWRNAPAGDWLDVRNRTRFAAAVGIDRRSLGRVLERVVGWDLAEQSPAPESELPGAWPTRIRLRREQVLAALRKARLDAPER